MIVGRNLMTSKINNQDIILIVLAVIAILYILLKIIDTIKQVNYTKLKKDDAPSNEECYWRCKYKKESDSFVYKCARLSLFSGLKPSKRHNKCNHLVWKNLSVL